MNHIRRHRSSDIFTAACPSGFTTYIKSVNSCYKVVNYNLNWEHAELVCQSPHSDAHLLIINDAAEQDAVATMLTEMDR